MNKQSTLPKKSLEQTTSTSFYIPSSDLSPNLKQPSSSLFSNANKNQFSDSLIFHHIRNIFPQISSVILELSDQTQFMLVEQELSLVKKILRKCQANLQTKCQFTELYELIAKLLNLFKQTKQKHSAIMAQTKQNIQVLLLQKLQKLLKEYKKQWQRIRQKCEAQLKQEIQEIKTMKSANEQFSLSILKKTALRLRQQTNDFTQELKGFKKSINGRNSSLFGKLESVRNSLNQAIVEEEQKRCEYDEIIYNLLDKTCQNAADSLRRRVY